MRGLLADVNLQGHLPYLRRLLVGLDCLSILAELGLSLVTFPDVGLQPGLDDRSLWNHCQREGWVLFTDNRNNDGVDSLQATLADSWRPGPLPILTLANKDRFQRRRAYGERVASHVADLLFDIKHDRFVDQPRIFVPSW